MEGTPVSTIEEEDEDLTTNSASLTSEMTPTSLQTALKKNMDAQKPPSVHSGQHQEPMGKPGTSTAGTSSTDQDTTLTGDLPLDDADDDPSSGSTENADDAANADPHDFMTSSYTEISFGSDADSDAERDMVTETDDLFGDKELYQSTKNNAVQEMASSIVSWTEKAAANYDGDADDAIGGPMLTDERPPTREWTESSEEAREVVSFVAEDFDQQLKLSSPLRDANSSASRSSTIVSDATDLQEDDLDDNVVSNSVAIDYHVLNQIESQIAHMNGSVDAMMSLITKSTHSLSKLTVECVNSYQGCLYTTCDSVDSNIKSMYQLMAQVEELNRSMKSVHDLNVQLNSVRHLLDIFEKKIGF